MSPRHTNGSAFGVLLAAAILGAFVAGCSPRLEGLTSPPPTKVAVVHSDDETIEISKGIALAFECTMDGSPCQNASAKIVDSAIATVHASYVDELATAGRAGMAPESVFVIVGREPGTTTLGVSTEEGDVEYEVEVVP